MEGASVTSPRVETATPSSCPRSNASALSCRHTIGERPAAFTGAEASTSGFFASSFFPSAPLFCSCLLSAAASPAGVGGSLASPLGLTAPLWTTAKRTIDAGRERAGAPVTPLRKMPASGSSRSNAGWTPPGAGEGVGFGCCGCGTGGAEGVPPFSE